MNILELIQNNKFNDALSACKEAVRDKPADIEARSILCQLFCFSGDWKRADTQLDTIAQQEIEMTVGVGLIRQLIRAEMAREQFFSEGRPPELIGDPDEPLQSLLKALIAVREGNHEELVANTAELREKLPVVTGTINGKEFDFSRDLDDLMSGYMEVLTTNGKYFLIPFAKISSLTFREPERLQDQIWRSASIDAEGGLSGEVYLPTRYCRELHKDTEIDEALTLGGETDWFPLGENGPITGQGQKMFVFGEDSYSMMELNKIDFQTGTEES